MNNCRHCGKAIGHRLNGACLACRYKKMTEGQEGAGRDRQGPAAVKPGPQIRLKCDPSKLPERGMPVNYKEKQKKPPFWEYYRQWKL